ncbi:putative hydrolases of HD superfamily [Gracilibacillus ureilyticus]|uniref:Putative hydrolases of HD superfamily n=2 Tax=Gracilibacillus ureilyticus TaxID=531814 RepID=A0A1H9VV96_9BACI|nr:putative hydrolases of HD superfamily [Gracilibacillus ureilyticus]
MEQIIKFLGEIDKFKSIERRTRVGNAERHENDAEHTWHMCMFALLLHTEIDGKINLERALKLILIHDLAEIYAGDTYAHDPVARQDKRQREELAAEQLFQKLPEDIEKELHELWEEYEANETIEAQFVQAIDKMQALSQNVLTNGKVWKENMVQADQIFRYNEEWSNQSPRYKDIFEYLWTKAERGNMFPAKKG